MKSFIEWLTDMRQDEMSLDYLRINPESMARHNWKQQGAGDSVMVPHAGELKMLGGEKLKRCLSEKFKRLGIPVHLVMDPNPTPEEKAPDPNVIKVLIKDRGGDPMTCWMTLHRVGHAGLGYEIYKGEIPALLNRWFKEYVKYYPEWGRYGAEDKKFKAFGDWYQLEAADLKFPLSKFLMFSSARKTADVVKKWASGAYEKGRGIGHRPQHGEDVPLRNPQHYDAFEGKSYALGHEFYHELCAEYLWNGRIRVNEDSGDAFVKDNPGYMTKMFNEISELIHQAILSLKGKVLDSDS
jgi:hypothetical protein